MQNTTQQGWATSPTYPAHQRTASGAFEERREPDPQYAQYNPMTYYPNQTRTSKPATPPASAPPVITSPTYYPRPEYQPASAPPHIQQQYAYYPGYSYDYSEYPRQPAAAEPNPLTHQQYDPRQYRPQQYYPPPPQQQYAGWQYPQQQIPISPPQPEKVAKKRPAEPEPKGKKKKAKKVEEPPHEDLPRPPQKSLLNPPRQAQSAWQLFFADELAKAKSAALATSPGGSGIKLNVAQVAKDAGTAYGNLDSERKAHYAQMVQESKEQYARELVAWQATLTPEDIRLENAFRAQQRKDGKSRKGNLKDPNAPKKPLSAYFLFLKTIREDAELRARVWGAETETTKQSVMAAERWRGLSDVEKKVSQARAQLIQPYLQRAEKDKAEYETAKKLYEDDSAARARGEEVPERPHLDNHLPNVDLPESMKISPAFESPQNQTFDQLAGFEDLDNQQEEWSDLHHLMEQHKGE